MQEIYILYFDQLAATSGETHIPVHVTKADFTNEFHK